MFVGGENIGHMALEKQGKNKQTSICNMLSDE